MSNIANNKSEEDYDLLNKLFAYSRNHPIYTPADIISNPRIGLSKLTWRYKRQTHRKWYEAHSLAHIKRICNTIKTQNSCDQLNLRDFLLLFGGTEVCITTDEKDASNILSRGQLWFGDRLITKRGGYRNSHRNAAHLWSFNENSTRIATGFVLTTQGIWKRHSWVIFAKRPYNKIVDNTDNYSLYFGYVLTEAECSNFYWDNY